MALTLTINGDEFLFSGRSYQITKEKNDLPKPYHKQVHNYGVILAVLPNEEQVQCLNQQIGNARFIRNNYLSERMEVYETEQRTLTVSEYKKWYLPKLKEEK